LLGDHDLPVVSADFLRPESGVDLVQIALIESESFSGFKIGDEKCYEILRKAPGCGTERKENPRDKGTDSNSELGS
jgi:hypothetical protein